MTCFISGETSSHVYTVLNLLTFGSSLLTNRHALQLRQAKLSFPSVHLLVGVPNDELCKAHKARTVLSHFERLESVRHCRWTDEVVPDAPWVITPDFIKKYQIDYVAHDEEPYADSSGSGDIYGPIKQLGEGTFSSRRG